MDDHPSLGVDPDHLTGTEALKPSFLRVDRVGIGEPFPVPAKQVQAALDRFQKHFGVLEPGKVEVLSEVLHELPDRD